MQRKSVVPWLVGAVCIGPFVLALLLFYGPWQPSPLPGSRELLVPPVATPAGWLADTADGVQPWSLVYARTTACDERCVQDLERLRQVHAALGRDADRVQRVYLDGGDAPRSADPALVQRRLDDGPGAAVARALDAAQLRLGRVYIADPRGNLVASYPSDVDQKELLRDLKRLLAGAGAG